MYDAATLISALEFARARLLGSLDAIEKSGQAVDQVLAWRPGPGRAHIAWQAMHCAATHDKYLHLNLQKTAAKEPALIEAFGGGSTPSDANVPTLAAIRAQLAARYAELKEYVASRTPAQLAEKTRLGNGPERAVGESVILLTWHEAHHQGQIHLTWNLYKAAHGVK